MVGKIQDKFVSKLLIERVFDYGEAIQNVKKKGNGRKIITFEKPVF